MWEIPESLQTYGVSQGNKWNWQPIKVKLPEFSKHQITIIVNAQNIPESSKLFITGNQAEIGEWNPAQVPLGETKDGNWIGSFPIKENKRLEFKITRGSWETEAVDINGQIPPNYILDVQSDTTLTINIYNWKDLVKKNT